MAGRWAVVDLTATSMSLGVCPGSFLYDTLTSQLNILADLRSNPEYEPTELPCNALSTGFLFDSGTPGTLVTNAVDQPVAAPSEPLPNPCAF